MQLTRKKAVIFDFDGTIANSHNLALESVIKVGIKYAKTEIGEIESLIPKLKEMTSKEIIDHFKVKKIDVYKILVAVQEEMYKKADEIVPFEGIKEALTELKKDGTKVGILTSNSAKIVKKFTDTNDLKNIFDFVYSDKNLFGKDKTLKKIMIKKWLNKNKVAYVGDETRDINAAHKAGVKAIAVTWGLNSKKRLEETNPTLIIDSPNDLVKIKDLI